jgi:N,N-dimethylformamidase
MELTGYSDRWSVRPGEDIAFHIHCTTGRYTAQLVRLRHGDESPRGPGFREAEVASPIDGSHDGAPRTIRKGSYGVAPLGDLPANARRVIFSVSIWPTLPGPDEQGIVTWHDGAAGIGLFLAADGRLVCRAGEASATLDVPLDTREWYAVTVVADADAGRLTLSVTPARWSPRFGAGRGATAPLSSAAFAGRDDVLFAAASLRDMPDGPAATGVFNGKIARPTIAAGPDGAEQRIAAWDFFAGSAGTTFADTSGGGRDGRTVNRPARLMTGPGWPGATTGTEPGVATHDAIHFHDDDVADVGWPESHRLHVPAGLPSGVYALRLRTETAEDHLPFFVLPARDGPKPRLAVLMPTMSYLAYANESLDVSDTVQLAPRQDMTINRPGYAYVAANGLKSTYDLHRDGSGIAYGSLRRPIIDFRPKARCRTFDAPHQFAADLHLIDWLSEKGYAFDVITDDALHAEGAALLAPYRAVVTGSHPEYWSARMLDARDAWLGQGGRMMYLGGNGFYWVTGVAEDAPDVIEIRRYEGTRCWNGLPGEETLSVSGERGGLWRSRGRGPHAGLGVGFAGQGFDRGAPYRRTDAGRAPEWAWVFEGVDGDVFGAGPALVLGHGAAGFEVDKADRLAGTPAAAVVLASSEPLTDAYQGAIETMNSVHPWTGGSNPRSGLRADMVFLPLPEGGAVFSVGSITWSSTLSANGYDGDTSRITRNVLDAFLAEALPGTPG